MVNVKINTHHDSRSALERCPGIIEDALEKAFSEPVELTIKQSEAGETKIRVYGKPKHRKKPRTLAAKIINDACYAYSQLIRGSVEEGEKHMRGMHL